MAKKQSAEPVADAGLPQFLRIELNQIVEPELAARAQMSEPKMRELVESMRQLGQIEPITVAGENGIFEVVTGHRRFLAARELKWSHISALVYRHVDDKALAMRLHENIIREDLNPAEEALYMAQARDKMGLDEAGLCQLFRRTPNYVGSRFALLRGDEQVFAALQRGEVRLGVAHELNRITDEQMRRYYLDCARRSDPPAHVVHRWVEDWRGQADLVLQSRAAARAAQEASATEGEDPRLSSPAGEAGAPGPGAAVGLVFGCELCGGTKDPWNLINVRLHKWHWDEIQKAVERAGKGEG